MKAKSIMTNKIVVVQKDDMIVDAAKKMKQTGVGTVAVEDQGKIVGIISDRDIVLRDVAENQTPGQSKCGDIMTSNVATASPESSVDEISQIMSERQVKRVPIVEQEHMVGMVSLGDLAQTKGQKREAGSALKDITSKPGLQ
ncbi:CBS domain-containing protein [Alkalibaculum sp. M08DMB]|uniref:CBS domain-containing protein n=1 Tax=Alkalibaculum sporogenes TaxID=2655001 RepID=A0A6A7K8A1_9FIRM|nr:CBS domain-containing protein [Alkalibaculum sporogenes]MPW25708.1 CBS domain-containing protein [Alkalibaculum sporogenes]